MTGYPYSGCVATAVAQMMNDVGVATLMQYTPSASGTQGVFAYQALQKHFDYTSAYVTKAVEGPTRFAEILRQELLNGCPVYLEGRPAGSASGHAWVADGFDENGLFHMNFGWEGQGDAYYSLVNLNLSQTGSEFQGKPLAFNLFRHVTSADACHATLSLQGVEQGVCLLRVEAEAHCHTYRFIHDANPSA